MEQTLRPKRHSSPLAYGIEARSPVHEVNQLCIELLTKAAWEERPALPLVRQLQRSLRNFSREARLRAAQHPFLLVDIQFANQVWWETVRSQPGSLPPATYPGHFPRSAAIQLGRAAIMLLHHSSYMNESNAVLLGAHPAVLKTIRGLTPPKIERIVERAYRDIRARWEDQPALWHNLILASSTTDFRPMRGFNLRALRALAGEVL